MSKVKYLPERKAKALARLKPEKQKYEDRGYKVTVFKVEDEGIDMIAENDREVIGLEVTNWNRNGYMNNDRYLSMVSNWNDHEKKLLKNHDKRVYKKMLVYNYPENVKNYLALLLEMGINLEQIGHEDLP